MEFSIRICTGPEVGGHLADAARIRISVFREFPYLYDGDPDYERRYLEPSEAPTYDDVNALFDFELEDSLLYQRDHPAN